MRGVVFGPLGQRLLSRQANLTSRIFIRGKAGAKGTPKSPSAARSGERKNTILRPPEGRRPPARETPSKPHVLSKPRATPQSVLIYDAGTGKFVFLGVMRAATILLFGASVFIVVPAFWCSDEWSWYYAPAIAAASAIPMVFVGFTAAPMVSQVHLAIPTMAQHSREAMMKYLKNVPRTADLSVETIQNNLLPRRNQVSLNDLVPAQSNLRPVSFMNPRPRLHSGWKGRDSMYFYAPEKSRRRKGTHKFFPEVWEQVFAHIKQNGRGKTAAVF